ncbi:MAG: hypothetical protein GXP27_00520, partial [Planctomycetes bacterium]|nr:hypothetical protein [Planctomycetota bacterium]
LFPQTTWIVCIRDPFRAIESLRNTFQPDADVERWLRVWLDLVRWAQTDDRVLTWRIDAIPVDFDARLASTSRLLQHCDLNHTPETIEFVRRWPVVHKVRPNDQRKFQFTKEDCRRWIERIPELTQYLPQYCQSREENHLPS